MTVFKILKTAFFKALVLGVFVIYSPASVDDFRRNYAEDYEHYTILVSTSLEYASFVSAELESIIDSILIGIERRIEDPEAMREYLEKIRALEFAKAFDLSKQEFATHLNPTDEIYFFRYSESGYSDYGILVLREGDIVFREPYGWSRHGSRDGAEEVTEPKRIDRLTID